MHITTDRLNIESTPRTEVLASDRLEVLLEAVENAQQPAPSPAAVAVASPADLVVDWNACRPDGTELQIQKLLSRISLAFGGDVALSISCSSAAIEFYSTGQTDENFTSTLVRSATIEASQAKSTCLFAAVGGQSSLLLQQVRQLTKDALLLGFGASSSFTTKNSDGPSPNVDTGQSFELGLVVRIQQVCELQDRECYSRLISMIQQDLPIWLATWRSCRAQVRLAGWRRRLHFCRSRPGQIGVLVATLLLISMVVPVPYWPQRECVVEPAFKSFVASPIDGRIRNVKVRPGDIVSQGQLLAQLDDEQLLWSLSASAAEYEAAGKRRDAALATRAGGELRLAQLEKERIALEIQSLEQQLERLELRSPAAGVVVQGDWFQSDGAPVSRGDMLFEIAPMDSMRVDVHLSTEDLAHVRIADNATIRVDAAPSTVWSAELNRIDPRGKVIDSQVVFEASMDVANRENLLRPGMKGRARISAGTQTIGWLLFHRPYGWAMKKMAW